MQEVSREKNAVIARISKIVEKLIQGDSLFQELDKDELNVEVMSGLISDFPLEEREEFVAAVSRRDWR